MRTVIYKLTVEDVQNVALQELDRELTRKELIKIEYLVGDRIPWYDAIASAIEELVGKTEEDE